MAKGSSGKTPSSSRIRFVMVEAELGGDGDISQITQAIQNALRSPASQSVKRIAPAIAANGAASDVEIEPEAEDFADNDIIVERPPPAKSRAARKPSATPDIVQIDMNTGVSLASFALGKDASSQHKKYLIAAAWLKEHRDIDGVTAGHVYTCFRSMDWSTNIPDFWQPLRDLKAKKYFTKNEKNEYEINHIGLDYVKKKLGGTDGAS